MSRIETITKLGQSVWLDFISRDLLQKGELTALRDAGVRGLTSNPTIFEKAIGSGATYDADLARLAREEKSIEETYETLVISDIQAAADVMGPVYEETHGEDGYVSLEVNPTLARDGAGTLADARRLFDAVNRPNLMIKIPGTQEGLPAVTGALAGGINVNVTLIFSLAQYEAVVEAYLAGLERLAAGGGDVSRAASVASFFVSRVDTAVDKLLAAAGRNDLRGRAAVANAKLAYARFKKLFAGPRWEALAKKGARVQRPLWASTGTKDPSYKDTLYVDTLIGPHTVNTMPPATLKAFQDHGAAALSIEKDLDAERALIAELAQTGINMTAVTDKLLVEGLDAFEASFSALLRSVTKKTKENVK